MGRTFDRWLPRALALGMGADEYWHGDCMAFPAVREADRIRADRENRVAWLNGLYVYRAIGAVSPLLNPYSKRRTAHEYPEPLVLDPREAAERRMERGLAYMRAMAEGRAQTMRRRADG